MVFFILFFFGGRWAVTSSLNFKAFVLQMFEMNFEDSKSRRDMRRRIIINRFPQWPVLAGSKQENTFQVRIL
jgi:hypothetical protein